MCHGNRSLIENDPHQKFDEYEIDMNEYMQLSSETFGEFDDSIAENNSSNNIY